MGKLISLAVFHFIIFFTIHYSSTCCHAKITKSFPCVAEERRALLQLRQSLSSANIPSSWNHSDCCAWEGVECDNVTGHVLMLDLNCMVKYRVQIDDLMWVSNLTLLEHLDLSYVNLSQTKDVIKVLCKLPALTTLNLEATSIGNINMNFQSCVNSSPLASIQDLFLSQNSFSAEFPCFILNMSSLEVLHIFENELSGSIPESLGNLSALTQLNISHNNLSSPIPISLGKLSALTVLDISYNNLSGPIPVSLGKLSALIELDISDNNLSGPIPVSLGKLSALIMLNISDNNLSGPIPISLGKLSTLTVLDISYNNLSGPIPPSLGILTALRVLHIENNRLSGDIPISLGNLSNLEIIDLSSNSFNGTFFEAHFAKLSKSEEFIADNCSNMLNFVVGSDWVPPFQLISLSLTSVKMKDHQIPQWIRTQKNLGSLTISNCGIEGTLPKWLGDMDLGELNLSHNHIVGQIPKLSSGLLQLLDLSDNMMNGSMPPSLCEMEDLITLDLSKNHLSDSLLDCWSKLVSLVALRLSFNELSGVIPNSIGEAKSLWWLHLNNNRVIGELPSTLKNVIDLFVLDVGGNKLSGNLPSWIGLNLTTLIVLRLRNNNFYGEMPTECCQLPYLRILDIANNKLTGKIPSCLNNISSKVNYRPEEFAYGSVSVELTQIVKGLELEYKVSVLKFLFSLDLSNNNLHGEIHWELINTSSLINLNLSHNHLGGKIPNNIGDLKSLESLDLSCNHLVGTIPQSLSCLTSLSYLNLSLNNLFGEIPKGNQLQTLNDPSIYDGNTGLCGPPLQKECPDQTSSRSPYVDVDDGGANKDNIYFYGVVACGIAVGFWAFFGVLLLKRRWRQAYFRYIEVAINKMLGL